MEVVDRANGRAEWIWGDQIDRGGNLEVDVVFGRRARWRAESMLEGLNRYAAIGYE